MEVANVFQIANNGNDELKIGNVNVQWVCHMTAFNMFKCPFIAERGRGPRVVPG